MSEKKEFNKIVIPVDGSKTSKKAAKKGLYLSKKTGIQAIALYVVSIPIASIPPARIAMSSIGTTYSYDGELRKIMKKRGKEILDEIKNISSKIGVKIKTKTVEGIPDEEIINQSKKNDIIIMGSKGNSVLDRVLIGNVSEKVLHHSKSSVMIVR
jgi:nucleotide-binding universal stress UspA family protein